MKPKQRFIASVVKSAKQCETELPWARGANRTKFIAKRTTKSDTQQSA